MHVSNKCSIAIHCLIFIHEYGAENKVTSELLSLSTGCNPVTIRVILSALKKGGVLYVKSGTGGATSVFNSCSRTRRYNTLSDLYSSGTGCH